MTNSTRLNPFKRYYRNRLRVKHRILPTELPPPFFHASDIKAVTDYFSGVADDRLDDGSEPSNGLYGLCYLCDEEVVFRIDLPTDADKVNWRETLVCPHCKLINRWRSCLHVFEAICKPAVDDRIYLTETLSPIYQNLAGRFPLLSASEYFPDHEFGEMVETHTIPVRNEDVTKLSFRDASKDIILCFDVLEHVPDYRSALREFQRVRDTGGQLVISVPFSFQPETIVRAKLDETGNIQYLTEPCYHGDPLSDQGVLSYYDFGVDLLDELRGAGFQECFLSCYYSKKWAYLNRNVVYVARKLKSSVKKSDMVRFAWEGSRYQAQLFSEKLGECFRYTILSVLSNFNKFSKPRLSVSTQSLPSSAATVTEKAGVNELPEIFHYWSNKFLATDMSRFGFGNPEEFFFYHTRTCLKESKNQPIKILSLGSGNCAFEIRIAEKLLQWQLKDFVLECLETNPEKLEAGKQAVDEAGLGEYFDFTCKDPNRWKPFKKYEIIFANQSFHDVQNLEGLFDSIKRCLKPGGLFIVSDMIGRNGQMRWPETMDALRPFWDELPESYRYNRMLNRHEEQPLSFEGSAQGFGSLRSQDILSLLLERFHFKFFFPYGNIIFVFIDRSFGHNFDAEAEWDKDFIDRVQAHDEAGLLDGELKPVSMLAVLTNRETELVLRHPGLTPRQCVRPVIIDGVSKS